MVASGLMPTVESSDSRAEGGKRKEQTRVNKTKILKNNNAVAGDRTRVVRVTGGNTHHYTTTTLLVKAVRLIYLSIITEPSR